MVNVCGEVFDTFAMVRVSPPSTVRVEGSKKKSFWSTMTVAAWPVPGPRIPPVTNAAIVISAITDGTQSPRAGLIPPLPFERSPFWSGPGYYERRTGRVWALPARSVGELGRGLRVTVL